ncbi:MAG: M3 family metallopeptidase [Acidimicrobiales bacterium]
MATDALPRWDLSDVYPSAADRSLQSAIESLVADARRLEALYDRHGVGRIEPRTPTDDDVTAAEEVLLATNDLQDRLRTPAAYAYALVTVDSRDDHAQAALAQLDHVSAALRRLSARATPWFAALGPDALAARSPLAADHVHPLRRLEVRAAHQMGPEAEDLLAELALSGSSAWARLWGDVTSQLTATIAGPDGTTTTAGMAAVRALAADPDPAARRAAYDAELAAWPSVAVVCAAAMNGVKGEAGVVNRRRGWATALDASLEANGIDAAVYGAMDAAVTASLGDFRRWMRAKAALLGHDGGLPWWDLFAPLPGDHRIGFEAGCEAIETAFAGYSPALAGLVRRAVGGRWVDAEPRQGKRGGGYCISMREDESRIFMNWSGSADAVSTLAHELGHAYHNVQLAGRTPMQRQLPMALAETASIFCETVMTEAGLAAADDDTRLRLLDVDLQGATQVVVDIRSRVLFETEVFERRAARPLSADELCDAMVRAQDAAYGDGLAAGSRHRYMWAVKPHYYSSHFYNWPYTFGLLLGLGLHAAYRRDPERFRASYDDLLSRVGMAPATELAAPFGFDLADEAFWTAGLDTLRARIDTYEGLAAARRR